MKLVDRFADIYIQFVAIYAPDQFEDNSSSYSFLLSSRSEFSIWLRSQNKVFRYRTFRCCGQSGDLSSSRRQLAVSLSESRWLLLCILIARVKLTLHIYMPLTLLLLQFARFFHRNCLNWRIPIDFMSDMEWLTSSGGIGVWFIGSEPRGKWWWLMVWRLFLGFNEH